MKTKPITIICLLLISAGLHAAPTKFKISPKYVTYTELDQPAISTGAISDEEFQIVMRGLARQKGTELKSFPSITFVSDGKAHAKVGLNKGQVDYEIDEHESFDRSISARIEKTPQGYRIKGTLTIVVSQKTIEDNEVAKTASLATETTLFNVAFKPGEVVVIAEKEKLIFIPIDEEVEQVGDGDAE
ncbi:hypothetical protein [Luteolibacter sp. AS25]|uniref:hypothetical protein n=1 Tax=Luteolibacter sp. AS25 TaxID=3135776 RepID=UPI00398B5639